MKITFVFLFLTSICFSQEEPSVKQFWNNYSSVNLAFTGIEKKHQATVLYQDRSNNDYGLPKVGIVNYNYQLNEKHSLGVNYFIMLGESFTLNSAVLNYSYKLQLGEAEDHFLSLGVGLGLTTYNPDYDNWIFPMTIEPFLSYLTEKSTFSKLNLGLAYKWKKLLLGFGATQILGDINGNDFNLSFPHVYANASYEFSITDAFDIIPRVQYKTARQFQTVDANVMATFKKKYSVSLGLRNKDAFIFGLQYDLFEKIRLGYSFSQNFNNEWANSNGKPISHEFVLGFQL